MSTRNVLLLALVATFLTVAFMLVPARPAPVIASEDPGIIAYVRRSTHAIHVISPDGTGDRMLWDAHRPLDSSWGPLDLAWRPDGRELAFSSDHEENCSLFQTDVYAISYNGNGHRRITNGPACAALANLPKGSVTVYVSNWTDSSALAYVMGAPGLKSVPDEGTVTFDNVADLGPGVVQPAVGIYGLYRIMGSEPFADVQPNETVPGGNLFILQLAGSDAFGTGKISWKADGSALAYGMRSASDISEIPANPPYGSIGVQLPVVEFASPGLVAWNPVAATEEQYLYYSGSSPYQENVRGIYLNTVGDASGGTQLVVIYDYSGQFVHDIEWLPDASGFLFTMSYVDMNYFSDIFAYNFATQEITQLTPSLSDEDGYGGARALSISPDGQQIVFGRALFPEDMGNSLWIMNWDGSGLRILADDAGLPAWGPSYVPEAIEAKFVSAPTSGVAPLLVQFTNQSTGDYDTCTWSFGDGSTSTSCGNPTHTYATKGVYTVALTASGASGTDTVTRTGSITVYDPVQADFIGSPTSGGAPLMVVFSNQSTGDYDTCTWSFGDGGTSTSCSNPSHIYTAAGAYTVTLTASGTGGSDTATRPGYISLTEPTDVNFSADPTSGIAPLSVSFTNLSAGEYDNCTWDFGDGGTSSDCNDPSHQYGSPGVYTVTLTAEGPGGSDSLTRSSYITVYAPVAADFTASPTSGVAPLKVVFSNGSSGDYSSSTWDFGDGATSTASDPSHTYTSAGTYTVTLTVGGPGGTDTQTRGQYIRVQDVQDEYRVFLPLALGR